MSVALQARREEGRRLLRASRSIGRVDGLLLVRRGAVAGGDQTVAAEELRHPRAGSLDRLARVAEALAHELPVLPLRLNHVLEPLSRKRDCLLLGVANSVGDRVVDPRDVRRPLRPPAAHCEQIPVALAGAFDQATCEAVVAVGDATHYVEDPGLALENRLAQPVTGSSSLASCGHVDLLDGCAFHAECTSYSNRLQACKQPAFAAKSKPAVAAPV